MTVLASPQASAMEGTSPTPACRSPRRSTASWNGASPVSTRTGRTRSIGRTWQRSWPLGNHDPRPVIAMPAAWPRCPGVCRAGTDGKSLLPGDELPSSREASLKPGHNKLKRHGIGGSGLKLLFALVGHCIPRGFGAGVHLQAGEQAIK